jgi:hypothetical protein
MELAVSTPGSFKGRAATYTSALAEVTADVFADIILAASSVRISDLPSGVTLGAEALAEAARF